MHFGIPRSDANFCPPSISLSPQKYDRHWGAFLGPSPDCRAGLVSAFAHKIRITARCSLQDDVNGNVAIFNLYKSRCSDVIVIKLKVNIQN